MNVVTIRKYRTSTEAYYLNYLYHRLNQDKPAYIRWDGWRTWYRNGLTWRENGFAVIDENGLSYVFFKDGIRQWM